MLDFQWVGIANLWKSGPLFSTGGDNEEPVTRGAQIEVVLASTQFRDCFASRGAGGDAR
jgi:hypothetical protein